MAGNPVLVGIPSDKVRILSLGVIILALDQLTKWIVEQTLPYGSERIVIDGFFKFVHWGNTGSAWSLFRGNNQALAAVSAIALVLLWLFRTRFDSGRKTGQVALGLLFGGISGNLVDRLVPARQYVVDFIYFHLHPRGGQEIGFPAFNVADSAICTGVGLLILLSLLERPGTPRAPLGS
ncbi:MAG: signal peptidase II [Pedosphaera sp.]|nr:signal peptidase II [Pedosphaera sp.]